MDSAKKTPPTSPSRSAVKVLPQKAPLQKALEFASRMLAVVLLSTSALMSPLGAQTPGSLDAFLDASSSSPNNGNGADSFAAPAAPIDTDIRPEDVVFWDAIAAELYDNDILTYSLRLRTERDFTLYVEELTFTAPLGAQAFEHLRPSTVKITDPVKGGKVAVYPGGNFELRYRLDPRLSQQIRQGQTASLEVRYIGCTSGICLFPHTVELEFPVRERSEAFPDRQERLSLPSPFVESGKDGGASGQASLESTLAEQFKLQQSSWLWLLFICFVGGMLTNLTPCVYPMFPITLRILAGQGASPWLGSSLYGLGILVTYTSLGLIAGLSGGLFGSWLASPLFNLGFAALMALFGLSMLGAGNLTFLQNLGNRLGSGKTSPFNTFLMGAGAGLVAAPCTGPILAALLAFTAQSQNTEQATLMLCVYSLGFALPYVALGGAAAKVSRIKVSPSLQNGVKLVFAGVMFTVAFYYLRIPAYQWLKPLAPYWLTMAAASTAVGAAAVAMLAHRKAPADQQRAHLSFGLQTSAALILGFGLFSFWQWSSLPPADAPKVRWFKSEQQALEQARITGKPILIDAWAEWCQACKEMDATTFVDPKVVNTLNEHWIPLKLDLTENSEADLAIQQRYGIKSLPTLVLWQYLRDQPPALRQANTTTPKALPNKPASIQDPKVYQRLIGYQSGPALYAQLVGFAPRDDQARPPEEH